jgi:hypothetical protein
MTENKEIDPNTRQCNVEIIFSTNYENISSLPTRKLEVERDSVTQRYKTVSGSDAIDDVFNEIFTELELGVDVYRVLLARVEFLHLRTRS